MLKCLRLAALAVAAAGGAHAGESLQSSLKQIDAGEYEAAAKSLEPLARRGDAEAQMRLGLLHFFGRGVPEDESKALVWLRKAAERGHVEAMLHLGNALIFGSQAPRLSSDPDREAAQWYFRAASAGSAEAQYNLGLLFLAGKGVAENREEAFNWIGQAAEQKHEPARRFMKGLTRD